MADRASTPSSGRDSGRKSEVTLLTESPTPTTMKSNSGEGGPQMLLESCYSKSLELNKLETHYLGGSCNHKQQQYHSQTNGNENERMCSSPLTKGATDCKLLQKEGSSLMPSPVAAIQASLSPTILDGSACNASSTTMETADSIRMNHCKSTENSNNNNNTNNHRELAGSNSLEYLNNLETSTTASLSLPDHPSLISGKQLVCPIGESSNVLTKGKQKKSPLIDDNQAGVKVKKMWLKFTMMSKRLNKSKGKLDDDDDDDDDDDKVQTSCKSGDINGGKQKRLHSSITTSSNLNTQSTRLLARSLIHQQSRGLNSLLMIKFKTLISLIVLAHSVFLLTEAGFWTFYFPNFLKPSGYKELSDMIHELEREMNVVKDTYSDTKYFWNLLEKMDQVNPDDFYPEESVCSDIFPMFRDLAFEYTKIDYEHYIKPMEEYHEHLVEFRSTWFREGAKTKTTLPREWEQKLQERDLELKLQWHTKLTTDEEFKKKREKLVKIWRGVRRSMDSSLACLYLKYAFRQISEDINQMALELNLESIRKTIEMLRSAYKRIEKFKNSDEAAIKKIGEVLEEEERLEIRH